MASLPLAALSHAAGLRYTPPGRGIRWPDPPWGTTPFSTRRQPGTGGVLRLCVWYLHIFRTAGRRWAVYDYVIVGAGSAGCVLAGRLTENPATRVLLLEAGPPDDADEIHIPAAVNLMFQSTYDWNYQTVPQERAAGRSIYWPRGRTLGGSSSINPMIYIRGSPYDCAPRRAGDRPGDGRRPRGRRALPAAGGGGDRSRRGRGDPGRRRDRQPAAAHAVRDRPRR